MIYNIVLVSDIYQHESAISIICPYAPSLLNLPSISHPFPSRSSHSTKFELPALYSKFPLNIYFTYGNVYVSMLLSQLIPPCPPTVSTSLFSMSASPLLLLQIGSSVPFLRFHIYALIYSTCFLLSDSLHSA